MPTTIGIADYQKLFLHTLTALIDQFPGYLVTVTATNATSLLQQLSYEQTPPDILLIDVRLPGIGGSLASSIAKAYPALRTLALMQTADDTAVIGLLKAGWRGFVLKEHLADTLEGALSTLAATGFYNGDTLHPGARRPAKKTRPLGSAPREQKQIADANAAPGTDPDTAPKAAPETDPETAPDAEPKAAPSMSADSDEPGIQREAGLTEAEQLFLDLACSDRSYKEIALEMGLSERVIEGLRNTLFARLQVHSRAGLALEAIRRQLITT